jgi:(+)-trans-carveol dehydrogenase
MGRLSGKVALVTGAAAGQGRAEAVRLAKDGADIIAIDIAEPVETNVAVPSTLADLQETARLVEAEGRRAVIAKADVRDYDTLRGAVLDGVRELGRLDIVVANAGIVNYRPLEEVTEEEWDAVVDTCMKGVWHTVKAAVPVLKEQGTGGSIVLTSSSIGVRGMQNLAHYAAAKHGVNGFMMSAAIELAPWNIRVNSVAPTTVNTGFIHNKPTYDLFAQGLPEDKRTIENVAPIFASVPLMNTPWIEPEDIANAVAFLASDEARFVTGLIMKVDAGQLVK